MTIQHESLFIFLFFSCMSLENGLVNYAIEKMVTDVYRTGLIYARRGGFSHLLGEWVGFLAHTPCRPRRLSVYAPKARYDWTLMH